MRVEERAVAKQRRVGVARTSLPDGISPKALLDTLHPISVCQAMW